MNFFTALTRYLSLILLVGTAGGILADQPLFNPETNELEVLCANPIGVRLRFGCEGSVKHVAHACQD